MEASALTQARNLRLEWVDPSTLSDNPENWRRHDARQRDAQTAQMAEVGWAGALLYNERTGKLLDGHMRKGLGTAEVPVLVGSWTEEQERLILATLDPIGAMAQTDTAALARLKDTAQGAGETLQRLLQATQKPSMILEGAATTRSGVAAAPAKPAAEQERWPLAIVLGTADYRRWKAVKEGLGVKDDGKAFVACLDAMEGE